MPPKKAEGKTTLASLETKQRVGELERQLQVLTSFVEHLLYDIPSDRGERLRKRFYESLKG